MPRNWPNRLLASIAKRQPRTKTKSKKQRRRVLVESLENRRLLAVVAYDESILDDLTDDTAAPTFLLDTAGTNTWRGTLETPADGQDGFSVELASGIGVSDIRISYTDAEPASDPDTGVRASGTGVFGHSFAGSESVAAGAFSDLNPTLPIENATYVQQFLTAILFEAADATPAADWQLEIDTVDVPLPPMITTTDTVTVDENETFVIDVESIDDNDSEGSGLVYSITGGADQTLFSIDANTGVVQFNTAPNFEAPSDAGADNVYEVEVTVTDSGALSTAQSLQITVADVNEAPVAEAGGPYAIDAGLALSVDATGTTDPDAGDTLTYGWDLDQNGVIDFMSAGPVATIPWLTVIDHISVGSHMIDLIVTDAGGLTSTDSAALDISDLFIYPSAVAGVDQYTLEISGLDLQVNDSNIGTLLSRVPVADITQIAVQGNVNADTLTIDYGGGFIEPPISYDGADPTTGAGDSLILQNGTVELVTHTFVDESTGSIDIVFDSTIPSATTIQYTGLEPIIDNLSAIDRVFTFTGGSETITLSDNLTAGDDTNLIDSDFSESVEFLNPTNSLTINAGIGVDQIHLNALDTSTAFSTFEVNGDEGDDTINVNAVAASLTANLNGGVGNDTFNIGSTTLDAIEGAVVVAGGDHTPIVGTPETIVAKESTTSEVSVTQTLDSGDTLNVNDSGSTGAFDYAMSDTTFTRMDRPVVPTSVTVDLTYGTVETVNVTTGSGEDLFEISGTAPDVRTTIDTGAGNDTLTITTTGDGSVVIVMSGDGQDALDVTSTGTDSITRLLSGAQDDDVMIVSTGLASGLAVDGAEGDDVVTLADSGADSATSIQTRDGSDVVNVRRTGLGSATDVFGGDGNDTINVTSDADGDRADADGNPDGTLDGILGELCVEGGDHDAGMISDSVTARETIGMDVTRSATVETGDTLNVSDEGSVVSHGYTVAADTLQRLGIGSIAYLTFETLNMETTQGDSDVAISTTAAAASFNLTTFIGRDNVSVTSTGANSISRISTGVNEDTVAVASTGSRSVTKFTTGVAIDRVSVASLGDQAGLEADTGAADDVIELQVESLPPARTGSAAVRISAGDGNDEINVNEVFVNSVVDLSGDADDDTFNLNAAGADSRGYLQRINNDPGGTSEIVASSRQLFLDGGVNSAGTNTVTQGVSSVAEFPVEGSVGSVATGDRVVVNAVTATNPLDLRYAVTASAQAVLATTIPVAPGSPRNTTGNEVFETLGVESVDIGSGSADDLLTVSSSIAFDINATNQLLDFNGGGGTDKFEVDGTAGNDFISVGQSDDGTLAPMEISNVELVRIDGNDGDDQISTQTPTLGALNGGLGGDTIFGGSSQDLLTGGPGIDFLFGGSGNDILLSDQDFGSDDTFITENEVLNGGSQDSLSPGDVCIQLGFDAIRDCETLGDGGGKKDVLTWLRGILIPLDSVSFLRGGGFLTPFVPVAPNPVVGQQVTEPSQIPWTVATLTTLTTGLSEYDPTDVTRDGQVSARDALAVINHLARMQGSASGEQVLSEADRSKDVNGNGTVEPLDALLIINRLARMAVTSSSGEGESPMAESWIPAVDSVFDDTDDEDRFLDDLLLGIGMPR